MGDTRHRCRRGEAELCWLRTSSDDFAIATNDHFCEGFRMPAAWGTAPLVRRPASESLQRRKPR